MDPIPAGFFPKRTSPRPEWVQAPSVAEICSVSLCVSPAPEDWIDAWAHNELGWYDSPGLAWSVAPAGAEGYEVFAYSLLPEVCSGGVARSLELPVLHVAPRPAAYREIGFDVVSKSGSAFFECSPLSCCNLAAEIPVNRYCLLDSLSEAREVAARFSREQPEPGNYYVVQVWRLFES